MNEKLTITVGDQKLELAEAQQQHNGIARRRFLAGVAATAGFAWAAPLLARRSKLA